MVNRVIIRLKVVQLLYSYLLSKSDFKVEMPTETSSPDRKYAYQAYAELLLLILELSGVNVTKSINKFHDKADSENLRFYRTNFSEALRENPDIRTLIDTHAERMRAFDSLVGPLADRLRTLPAYRTFVKAKRSQATPSDEIEFWTAAVRALCKYPEVVEVLRSNPDFTERGFETAQKMLIATLSGYGDSRNLLMTSRADLKRSLDEAYALYHWLLWLPVEITRAEDNRLDANANKYLPTEEDLHPDRRFVDAKLIDILAHHNDLSLYFEQKGINWNIDPTLIRRLADMVIQSEPYKKFMEEPGEKTIEQETELWRNLMRHVILPSDDLEEALENKSIFWNDDLEVMSSFALKTIKRLGVNPDEPLPAEFKDDEDAAFGSKLFNAAVANADTFRGYIDEFVNTKKWDAERVALMDIVILVTALAEAVTFPNIPLTVTTNEYVEIANWYSTSRSGAFVNGMFASIADKLLKEGRLAKKFTSTK